MTHNRLPNISEDRSMMVTERTAINMSGRPGSLYNAYVDCILHESSNVCDEFLHCQPSNLVQCKIIHDTRDKNPNVLRLIEVQDDLRTSILLNFAPHTGIGAIIDYPRPINKDTRILYYCYASREERLRDDMSNIRDLFVRSILRTTATHVITAVRWGMNAAIIIQLPTDVCIARKIDDLLEKVRNILSEHLDLQSFTRDDEDLFQQHTEVTIYSNMSDLRRMTSMYDICQYLSRRDENFRKYLPLSYTIKLIQSFYQPFTGSGYPWIQLESTYVGHIEQYLLDASYALKHLKRKLDGIAEASIFGRLKTRLDEAEQQWINLNHIYKKERERLQILTIDIRRGKVEAIDIDRIINNNESILLVSGITNLTHILNHLEENDCRTIDLGRQQFQYGDVNEPNINTNNSEIAIQQKLVRDKAYDRLVRSNDSLNKSKLELPNKLRFDLHEEHENNPSSRLIGDDAAAASSSYSSFEIQNKMIVQSNNNNTVGHIRNQQETSSSVQTQKSSLVSHDETINILLLGETGVGRSTFINALANYLTFNTLDEAQVGKSIIIIPVSFLLTVGDDFKEHTVHFGDVNDLKNEDFIHPGQSVTQHCKSYVFYLNNQNTTQLHIIDTPGFGDTRGIDQDDHNMQHIIQYLRNLSHINAVCFLLKPNESRLNIYFRSCLVQLFSLLGANIGDNVMFCFTNSRSTFYTPGNTGPLLRKMLGSMSMGEVALKKENTFCFDSESFRYLVACQNEIRFSDEDKREYEKSWQQSVAEANRLIDYVCNQLSIYSIKN